MSKPLEKVNIIPERDDDQHLPTATTPMEMLSRAASTGASVETLGKLWELQQQWEAHQARKDFDATVAAAKSEIPAIIRNRTGHNKARYADFAAIAAVVDPILARHGLSYRFRSTQGDRINVTCILSHKSGHSEETTLSGPADTSGNKNAVQAIGSTLTYLQRYSLVQALGLAAADDDDGQKGGASGDTLSQQQQDNLRDLLEANGKQLSGLLQWQRVERLDEIPAANYEACVNAIKGKRGQS